MASNTTRKSSKMETDLKLVVVESPAKARTISKILGKQYKIAASLGHIRDLPKGKLGIDVDHEFAPTYAIMKPKAATIKELKKLGKNANAIYLATDPDREGEAISWHLANTLGWDREDKPLQRVVFHEITENAILEAFQHTRDLDQDLINAQQARRILDRLVGYQLSPLLWKKIQRGLSAGRVQSVALRQIVDREKKIEAFVSKEYWTLEAQLAKNSDTFKASLHSVKGERKKIDLPNETLVKDIIGSLKNASYVVSKIKTEEKRKRPSPPFTTSTLQQEAWRKLRFSAKKTMTIAQQLYEGLPMGPEGSLGLITYMRTDSTSMASSAVSDTREYIEERFGKEYKPKTARVYKNKAKGAQEAHEAVRPTSIRRIPESLKDHLNRDQTRLYDLIWRRTVASQMTDGIYDSTSVNVEAGTDTVYVFRATGFQYKFLGFISLYLEGNDDGPDKSNEPLPILSIEDILQCLSLDSKLHFTQPPPRYTEATLVKLLEEKGIGRPSTYAPILSTLTDRSYVLKEKSHLKPTVLGIRVSEMLTEFFPDVMDIGFTANMEDSLDEIARGERPWVTMLKEFYSPFKKTLDEAQINMPKVRVEEPTTEICDKCQSPMTIKTGRFGRFIACSTFPACRSTKPILNKTGVSCPSCGGDLVERRSKTRRRLFYGCSKFPACDFSVVQKPVREPCPECGGLMLYKTRNNTACTVCAWQGEPVLQAENVNED